MLFRRRSAVKSADSLLPAHGDGAPAPMSPEELHDMAEMGFLDHLEELRWRIIKGLIGVLVGAVVCVVFQRFVIDVILLGPTRVDYFMYRFFGIDLKPFDLQNRTVTGQFFAFIGTVAVVGVIIGFPILIYQLWKFIEPGLYPHEKKGMRFSAVFATFFFILGISFGYFIIVPLALHFFSSFELSETIINEFDITKYFSMVTLWVFGAGLLFELPVVIYFLAKIGLLTPDVLRKSRRFAIVIILVIAAFITPPDPISQILMAVPLVLLYEGSIAISAVVTRKRQKEIDAALQ